MKKNKGITLVALVITIIVLLILAGVALSLIAGNEGILGKAETSVVKTKEASAKEQAELMLAEITADYYEARYVNKTESSDLSTYIKNAFGAGKATSNGEFFVTLSEDGTLAVYSGNSAESVVEANKLVSGKLENGKATWNTSSSGATGGGSGGTGSIGETYYGDSSVVPTDAKYFTFEINDSTKTATITGINEDYVEKSYYKSTDSYCVSGMKDDNEEYITDVVIPYQLIDGENTYTIDAIGNGVFGLNGSLAEDQYRFIGGIDLFDVMGAGEHFISFTLPNTIKTIGANVFAGDVNLESVNIPDSVTSIGEGAFHGCTSLSSINIPGSVASIGRGAFCWCTGLSRINIPSGVKSIGTEAFYFCSRLSNVSIGDSVTSIGEKAFQYCPNGCNSSTVTIDSSTIVSGLTSKTSQGYLIDDAAIVYIKEGITVSEDSYIATNYTKATTSSKEGYVMYRK